MDQNGRPISVGTGGRFESEPVADFSGITSVSGFIEFLSRNTQILGEKDRAYFLPVIFTTAQIWSSDVDLNSADVISGNVNFSKSECKNELWIAYQYHISPGLKHSCSPDERPNTIGQIMELEYIRTIPIVNSSGIEAFLRWSSNLFY